MHFTRRNPVLVYVCMCTHPQVVRDNDRTPTLGRALQLHADFSIHSSHVHTADPQTSLLTFQPTFWKKNEFAMTPANSTQKFLSVDAEEMETVREKLNYRPYSCVLCEENFTCGAERELKAHLWNVHWTRKYVSLLLMCRTRYGTLSTMICYGAYSQFTTGIFRRNSSKRRR